MTREVKAMRLTGNGMSLGAIAQHTCRGEQATSPRKSSTLRKLGVATSAALFLHLGQPARPEPVRFRYHLGLVPYTRATCPVACHVAPGLRQQQTQEARCQTRNVQRH